MYKDVNYVQMIFNKQDKDLGKYLELNSDLCKLKFIIVKAKMGYFALGLLNVDIVC